MNEISKTENNQTKHDTFICLPYDISKTKHIFVAPVILHCQNEKILGCQNIENIPQDHKLIFHSLDEAKLFCEKILRKSIGIPYDEFDWYEFLTYDSFMNEYIKVYRVYPFCNPRINN